MIDTIGMEKPKIAFAHLGITYGGVERWILEIAQNVEKFEVHSLALSGSYFEPKVAREFHSSKIKIFGPGEMDSKCYKTSSAKHALRRACRDADILLAVAGFEDLRNNLWGLSKPVVLVSHGTSSSLANMVKEALPAVQYLSTVAHAGLKSYPEHLRDSVAVIPNGISSDRLIPSASREDLRKVFGLEEGNKVVCQIARHGAEKNPRALIQAVSALPKEWIGVSVGIGPLTERLAEEARSYAPNRIIFAKEDTPIGDVLAISDSCILASDTECFPLVYLECWLTKTPLIVAEVETVKHIYQSLGRMFQRVPLRPTPQELAHCILSPRDEAHLDKIKEIAEKNFLSRRTVPVWEIYLEKVLEDWKLPTSNRSYERLQRVPQEEISKLW